MGINEMIDAVAVCYVCGKVRKDCKCEHVVYCTRQGCKEKAQYRGIMGESPVASCEKHVDEIDRAEFIEK